MALSSQIIWGYRRENGRVAVRNHVAILPLDDISNAACEAVAAHIQGTIALPHAYGRLQFGEDLDLHFRTMIGTGANPNVAACIVIGIEPLWTQKVVDGIGATGKPVAGFWIEGHGAISPQSPSPRVRRKNSCIGHRRRCARNAPWRNCGWLRNAAKATRPPAWHHARRLATCMTN